MYISKNADSNPYMRLLTLLCSKNSLGLPGSNYHRRPLQLTLPNLVRSLTCSHSFLLFSYGDGSTWRSNTPRLPAISSIFLSFPRSSLRKGQWRHHTTATIVVTAGQRVWEQKELYLLARTATTVTKASATTTTTPAATITSRWWSRRGCWSLNRLLPLHRCSSLNLSNPNPSCERKWRLLACAAAGSSITPWLCNALANTLVSSILV